LVAPALRPPERVVLVVEDEDAVRRITARILTQEGFHVLEACDGEEALALLEKLGPHAVWLVVSDIVMPRVTGNELAEIIGQKWPAIQVLLLSALAGPRGDFPVSFLQKPFTPDSLVAAARALLPSPKTAVG
jgi:two-component system cell cycle sensor histidine kinase/response regulator CckA